MKPVILCTSPTFGKYNGKAVKMLEDKGYEIVYIPQDEAHDTVKLKGYVHDAVAWIVGYSKISREVLESATSLKIATKHGTGTDNFDLQAAREKGVVITNTPGLNANAVADLAFALMLSLARKVPVADGKVRNGFWGPLMGTELQGKTLGVIGLGDIGKGLIKRAKGFEMDFVGFDPVRDEEFAKKQRVKVCKDYREVLAISDYISLHVPLNEKTAQMLGRSEFKIMKTSACVINTSRGGVIDERALIAALRNEEIAGAGLDVFAEEPPGADNELLKMKNVVLAPHMGAYTEEAMAAISAVCAENILRVLEGQEPLYRVV